MSAVTLLRRRSVLAVLGVAVLAGIVGVALFQPWKLVVDETVQEAAPPGLEAIVVPTTPAGTPAGTVVGTPPGTPAGGPAGGPAGTVAGTPEPVRETSTPAPGPTVLASGTFIAHEHGTTGTLRIIRLPDGRRVLRLDDLDTSNGPDLHVWITDAPVLPGRDGWFVFDDGVHVDLGRLKGNRGSQNYDVPASVDLRTLTSVTIWCDRFNVSFAAAPLTATT